MFSSWKNARAIYWTRRTPSSITDSSGMIEVFQLRRNHQFDHFRQQLRRQCCRCRVYRLVVRQESPLGDQQQIPQRPRHLNRPWRQPADPQIHHQQPHLLLLSRPLHQEPLLPLLLKVRQQTQLTDQQLRPQKHQRWYQQMSQPCRRPMSQHMSQQQHQQMLQQVG